MQTLFDVGDEIEVTVKGKIKNISMSENDDCYVVNIDADMKEAKGNSLYEYNLYFDSAMLQKCGAKLISPQSFVKI